MRSYYYQSRSARYQPLKPYRNYSYELSLAVTVLNENLTELEKNINQFYQKPRSKRWLRRNKHKMAEKQEQSESKARSETKNSDKKSTKKSNKKSKPKNTPNVDSSRQTFGGRRGWNISEHRLVYDGQRNSNGDPHGYGKRTYDDGEIHEGYFENGVKVEVGRIVYPDDCTLAGWVYEGEWSARERHGKGFMISPDGERIAGRWIDNVCQWRADGKVEEDMKRKIIPVDDFDAIQLSNFARAQAMMDKLFFP